MAMTLSGDNGVTFNDASLQGAAASPYVLKNRIINGAMQIWQRGTSFPISGNVSGNYLADRFYTESNVSTATSTFTQSTDVPTGAGFSYSLLQTVTAAQASVGAGNFYGVAQSIEGFNWADLMYGTANAKTATLSFWVKSSVTGSFLGSFCQSGGTNQRSYPFLYTISSANTWQQITVTLSGDTTANANPTTNGIGIRIEFYNMLGSTYTAGTANTWNANTGNTQFGTTGGNNLFATNGSTWYLTGVQLEIGTSATPFERRLYNQELANCQRYYYQITGGSTNTFAAVGIAVAASSTVATPCTALPVAMRSAPTISFGGTITVDAGPSNVATFTSLSSSYGGTAMCWFAVNVTGNALTVGRAANVYTNNATTNYVAYSAEL